MWSSGLTVERFEFWLQGPVFQSSVGWVNILVGDAENKDTAVGRFTRQTQEEDLNVNALETQQTMIPTNN